MQAKPTSKHPLPKGNSAYARAKRAEYVSKDTDLAKAYYMESISRGERVESSVKDLASLLHQEGKTEEAIQLIESNMVVFGDKQSVQNLLFSLKEKVVPKGNLLNKYIKVSGLQLEVSPTAVKNIFRDPSRITSVEFNPDENSALLKFGTHSAARKTLSTLTRWSQYKLEWVSVDGTVVGSVYNPWYKDSNEVSQGKAVHLLGKTLFALLT